MTPMNKRYSLLAACMMACTAATFAQEAAPPPPQQEYYVPYRKGRIDVAKLRLGAYIGPNVNWMHPTASQSNDGHYAVKSDGSKAGYMWGLMADYYFSKNYGLSTGFNLNTTGGKIAATATNKVDTTAASTVRYADFNYQLQYLEIPAMLKLRTDPITKSGLCLFGQVGLTLGVNISKKADYTVDFNDANGNSAELTGNNEKIKGAFAVSPLLLQLNVGGGVEYALKKKLTLYCGLFFNNGFLPSAIYPQKLDMGYAGSFTVPNTRENNIALRLGVFF
jgi:Outer membrane protein beta-barrel domain